MTSLEDYWDATIPEPAPGGVVGDGEWITQTLRKGFAELEGSFPVAYDLTDELLAAQPVLLDGRLAELPEDDRERWEYDLPAPLQSAPRRIATGLLHQYDSISRRDANLVASGAELVVRIVQKWVQQDGTPYPPPGYTADLRPIRSAPSSELRAAHFPIDCP